ncbi:hypothetical protein X773_13000 [Mesorhizobium sp. LSJC285A00]|uniref:hypothetical protein n=1 Tax=Mesorhizobium sp. LSJC285A00 TaxID=1287338 RepID=UPI0003CE1F7E|nr:hypothetical protein [Mesorhizobium sp. LSJC285A00]ESW82293.1 hypothetical protein X773_13000 [Mesorhizobium sp. LSJC285A00]
MNGKGGTPIFDISKRISLRRRDVLAFGGFALVNATLGNPACAEEGASGDAAAGQSSTAKDRDFERPDTTTVRAETYRAEQRPADLRDQLGLSFRAPKLTYDGDLSILGEFGSGPDRLSQRQGAFFVDGANKTVMSPEGSPLDTAFRWMLSSVPEASGTSLENKRRLDGPADGAEKNPPSKMLQALEAVEWTKLGSAMLEKAGEIAVDYTKEFTLDRIAEALGTQVMNKWLGYASFILDVVKPEEINGGRSEELTYFDRMSPAERRDFYNEILTRRFQFPTTLPTTGPTLQAPR